MFQHAKRTRPDRPQHVSFVIFLWCSLHKAFERKYILGLWVWDGHMGLVFLVRLLLLLIDEGGACGCDGDADDDEMKDDE